MRTRLLAMLILLFAAPTIAQAQVYPGWRAVPVPESTERGLRCIDGECANDTLQCVSFKRKPEKMAEGTRTEALIDNLTWGQVAYWLARSYLDERTDAGADLSTINNSRRVEPPTLKQSAGRSYVSLEYATTVGGKEAALPVALWVVGAEIRGLRCSYFVTPDDDPKAKIAQLLELVIAQ